MKVRETRGVKETHAGAVHSYGSSGPSRTFVLGSYPLIQTYEKQDSTKTSPALISVLHHSILNLLSVHLEIQLRLDHSSVALQPFVTLHPAVINNHMGPNSDDAQLWLRSSRGEVETTGLISSQHFQSGPPPQHR